MYLGYECRILRNYVFFSERMIKYNRLLRLSYNITTIQQASGRREESSALASMLKRSKVQEAKFKEDARHEDGRREHARLVIGVIMFFSETDDKIIAWREEPELVAQ